MSDLTPRKDPKEMTDEELAEATAAAGILTEQQARELLGLVETLPNEGGETP